MLDTARALEWIDGDLELLLMTLPVVRDQAITDQREIASAISENDSTRLKKASHRLKGSVGQIGAMRAQKVCAALELAAKNEESATFEQLQRQLADELDTLKIEIENFLQNHSTSNA